MTITIFISYAREDQRVAKRIARVLDDLDVEYFLDQKGIVWGDRVSSTIGRALGDTQAVIVVVSPASLKSQWVPFEVGFALGAGKAILPYVTHTSIDIPPYIHDLHYVTSLDQVRNYFRSGVDLGSHEQAGSTAAFSTGSVYDGPTRSSLRVHFFLAGCGVGNRLAVFPLPLETDPHGTGLTEVLESLCRIGSGTATVVEELTDIRDRCVSSEDLDPEALRNTFESYFAIMGRLPEHVRRASSAEEYQWFRLGELLYEVAMFTYLRSEEDVGSSDDAVDSVQVYVVALRALLEEMTLPPALRKELVDFASVADQSDPNTLMERANHVARTVYSAL